MLHPDLGPSRDPLASWQVDTDEIRDVIGLYSRHVAGVEGSEQLAVRLGLLWKKLGGASRLLRLVWEYAEMQSCPSPSERGARFLGRFLASLGRPPRRRGPRSPCPEEAPMYDRWLDP